MQLDARALKDGGRLSAEVCIIGAGPAGIVLAHALSGSHRDVLVLESGSREIVGGAQELNEGAVVGSPYAGLRATRCRALGGAARIWNTPVRGEPGAKYAPLDACDFEPGADGAAGWPFDRTHLDPDYRAAQAACGLGPFAYEAADWGDASPLPLGTGPLITRVYQFGTARRLITRKLDELRVADNIRVCHDATVLALELSDAGRCVTAALLRTAAGARLRVGASIFVLAAGAIENARFLLLAAAAGRKPWNTQLVGRGFMEHPRDRALTLLPASPELFAAAAFFDAHDAPNGTVIGGRLAIASDTIRKLRLPNASVTLLPRLRAEQERSRRPARILTALRRLGRQRGSEGYGWSQTGDSAVLYDAFRLIINLEQRPYADNRVLLDRSRDAFGVPRTVLNLRWRGEEQADLERLRRLIADTLESAGLGRVEIRSDLVPDLNAHHHAGTTRMHADPAQGVVDADGRVHGTDNLYVTGASIFPSAGAANPTLTIVALAMRLARLLRVRETARSD